MGIWYEIKPKSLGKKDRKHQWLFASYSETPSERKDNNWYSLFTFRNQKRTVFGKHERLEREPSPFDYSKFATKVIVDKKYRDSLVSDDPDLPLMWKKR